MHISASRLPDPAAPDWFDCHHLYSLVVRSAEGHTDRKAGPCGGGCLPVMPERGALLPTPCLSERRWEECSHAIHAFSAIYGQRTHV
jgi:hypothetical protein